jgi:hypothetical protein
MPKAKKGKKGKNGKKNAKQVAEEENLLHEGFLKSLKIHALSITGNPPPANVLKNLKGPADEKGVEDLPGYYNRRRVIQMNDIRLGPALLRALCLALTTSKYTLMERISMVDACIKDAGVTSLCEILTIGETLGIKPATLELISCDLSHLACEPLSVALSGGGGGNTALVSLVLDYNKNIKNIGLSSLCIGLRGNSTLKSLSLKSCGLAGNEMGIAISLLLSSTTNNLEHLNLANNKLTPKGLSTVSRALKKNYTLKHLDISENNIDADFESNAYDVFMRSMNHLRLALQMNTTLLALDLSFNTITEDGALQLLPALSPSSETRNNTLKFFKLTTLLSHDTFNQLSRSGSTGGKGGKKKKKKGGKKKKKK